MKKIILVIFSFTLLFGSCLQSSYNVDLDAFVPAVVMDIPASFSASGGSDMLIVTIQGGRFKDRVEASQCILKKGGTEIPLSVPLRDSDGMIIFGFGSPLSDGSYTLFINKNAFAEPAAKASVQAVKSGTWTDTGDGGFGRSRVWSLGYGSGKFVAVAANGKMAYSPNMGTWTAIRPGYSGIQTQFGDSDADAIRGIAWGDNRFIAVGHKSRVASSSDGISWQGWDESQFEGRSILCVTYGGDRFVAAGDSGKMNCKWNAGNWEKVTETRFGEKNILALAHGNPGGQALFVAAGTDGQLAWSSDSREWNYENAGFGGSTIYGLAWGNNVFVAAGDQGKIAWSLDGKNWQLAANSAFDSSGVLGVAFGGGVFLAAGHDGKMATSADGISWQAIPPGTGAGGNKFSASEQIQTVCYGGGRFVAAGLPYPGRSDRDIGRIVYSYQKPPVIQAPADTVSSPFNSLAGDNRVVITLAGGKFADAITPGQFSVNGGTGGFSHGPLSGRIIEKSERHVIIRLTSAAPSNGAGQTITVSASALAALPSGLTVSSEKEYIWKTTAQNPFGDSGISSIAHNGQTGAGSVYIAAGGAKIAKSTDGINWTEIPSTNWANVNDYVLFTAIAYGDGKFTAVGYWVNGGADLGGGNHAGWGVSAVSGDNGASWTLKDKVMSFASESISPRIYGIAHNGQTGTGSRFIAVGQWGRSAWSGDGQNWTAVQIASFNYLDNPQYFEDALDIAYGGALGGGKFVVVGKNGKTAFSENNGAAWKWNANILLGSGVHINTICFGNGTFIAAGNGGNMKTVLAADIAEGTGANGGEQWEGVDGKFSASGILDIAHNGSAGRGLFIAAGHDGKMSESGDGKNWMAVNAGNNEGQNKFEGREQITCVAWGNKRFVAGGNAYTGNTGKLTYSE